MLIPGVCMTFEPLHPAPALCMGWESPMWCRFGGAASWGSRGVITSIHPQPDQDEEQPTECTEPDSEEQPGWEGAPVTPPAPEEPCRLVLSTPSSILQEREIEEVRDLCMLGTGPVKGWWVTSPLSPGSRGSQQGWHCQRRGAKHLEPHVCSSKVHPLPSPCMVSCGGQKGVTHGWFMNCSSPRSHRGVPLGDSPGGVRPHTPPVCRGVAHPEPAACSAPP